MIVHMHCRNESAVCHALHTILIFLIAGAFSLLCVQARAESRVALVVGNSAYLHIGPLTNPRNDAEDIAAALRGLQFDVVLGVDVSRSHFGGMLKSFRKKLRNADVALLFYAGHGIAVGGNNYLIPVDAKMASADDLDQEAIRLDEIQLLMEGRPRTNLLIFDACRNDPFSRSLTRSAIPSGRKVSRGWVPIAAPKGTYISFATKPGDVASDGVGRNSPFTGALLKHIGAIGVDVQLMMRRVRKSVFETTNSRQLPWDRSSLVGEFYFAPVAADQAKSAQSQWIDVEKTRVRAGEEVRLTITPPDDCRLTLINVDDSGRSCLLFPHPDLPDTVLKGGQSTEFPPKGVRLRLDQPGQETFVALCNASPAAKQAAARRSRRIDCSVGASDRKFNDAVFETATLDLSGLSRRGRASLTKRPTLLRSSVTISVLAQ